jgi:hypothetical protein
VQGHQVMPGVVFFDQSRRLHMTIDDETLRPGVAVRAVPWLAPQRRWGPPTEVSCIRLARLTDLSEDELGALETPAAAPRPPETIRAIYPPGHFRHREKG